jgi:PASTA domain-containing protein
MKTRAGAKRRRRLAATAALLCALVASLALAVAPAGAESVEGSPLPEFDGVMQFQKIEGPSGPEEFSWLVRLGPEQTLIQVSETRAVVEYTGTGHIAFDVVATEAADADGSTVPTTLRIEGDVVTLIVHHREGNPAAGGAPFVYPIVAGSGWAGGFHSYEVQMPPPEAHPEAAPAPSPPAPICTVPSLRNLSLRAAKTRLRAGDCSIGQVRLAAGATGGKGKVVKQFRAAGTRLAAGAPVAVKLGSR